MNDPRRDLKLFRCEHANEEPALSIVVPGSIDIRVVSDGKDLLDMRSGNVIGRLKDGNLVIGGKLGARARLRLSADKSASFEEFLSDSKQWRNERKKHDEG